MMIIDDFDQNAEFFMKFGNLKLILKNFRLKLGGNIEKLLVFAYKLQGGAALFRPPPQKV